MIATTDALRPRAKIVVLRPATRAATGRLLLALLVARALAVEGLVATVPPAAIVIAIAHVHLREATDEADRGLAPAHLPATIVDRDRASARDRAAQVVFRDATIDVRPDLSPLARAIVATDLRATVTATATAATLRARAVSACKIPGASAVVPTVTARVREGVTEASVRRRMRVRVTEASVRRRLRVRVTAVLPPAGETVDRVRRRTLPRADRSAKAGTARREGPTSAPTTIPRVDHTRAPRSRGRLLLRVTCRASLPCCRGRKSGES